MKKGIILLLLCSATGFSQQLVNSVQIKLKRDRSSFQVVDTVAQKVALFISDKTSTHALLLDGTMKISDSITTPRPDQDYSELLGYAGNAQNPVLFWGAGNAKKKILSQQFNFDSKTVSQKDFSIDLKDERIIQDLSTQQAFYIVTIVKKSNIMKFYVFDQLGNIKEHSINMDNFHFFRSDTGRSTLYGMMEQVFGGFEQPFSLTRINLDSPTALTDSAKKRKCYLIGDSFYITNDSNIDYTQLISVNLKNFTATEKFLKQPFIVSDSRDDLNSNSFICGENIYQIKLASDQIYLTLKDFDDNILNQQKVLPGEEINFKNSPIRLEGGEFTSSRILDKTSQFTRKVNNSNSGLSCYPVDGKTLVTIGSVTMASPNNAMVIGGMFGVAGVLIAYAVSNPTMDNFNAYANRKVVYIDCLFDAAGNHLEGPIPKLAFDKIRSFNEDKEISGATMYRLGTDYFFGYYDKDGNVYSLRKFTDD